MTAREVPPRYLASVLGKLVAISKGTVININCFLPNAFQCLLSRVEINEDKADWDEKFRVPKYVTDEISSVLVCAEFWTGRSFAQLAPPVLHYQHPDLSVDTVLFAGKFQSISEF